MEVIPVPDLPRPAAIKAFRQYRKKYFNEDISDEVAEEIYRKVGGRLNFLNRIAKTKDMMAKCDLICEAEKTWFLNKCWILGMEMDDDVMNEQKYSVGNIYRCSRTYANTLIVCCDGSCKGFGGHGKGHGNDLRP